MVERAKQLLEDLALVRDGLSNHPAVPAQFEPQREQFFSWLFEASSLTSCLMVLQGGGLSIPLQGNGERFLSRAALSSKMRTIAPIKVPPPASNRRIILSMVGAQGWPRGGGSNRSIFSLACHNSTAWPSTSCLARWRALTSSSQTRSTRPVMWPSLDDVSLEFLHAGLLEMASWKAILECFQIGRPVPSGQRSKGRPGGRSKPSQATKGNPKIRHGRRPAAPRRVLLFDG